MTGLGAECQAHHHPGHRYTYCQLVRLAQWRSLFPLPAGRRPDLAAALRRRSERRPGSLSLSSHSIRRRGETLAKIPELCDSDGPTQINNYAKHKRATNSKMVRRWLLADLQGQSRKPVTQRRGMRQMHVITTSRFPLCSCPSSCVA